MKRIIKRDDKGLFISAEGSKCRPTGKTRYSMENACVEVTLSGIGRGGFFVELPNGETWPAEMPDYVVNPKKKARSPRKMQVRDLDEKTMYHVLKDVVGIVGKGFRDGRKGDHVFADVAARLEKAGFEFDRGRNGD